MNGTPLWIDGADVTATGPPLTSRDPSDESLVFDGQAASEEAIKAAWDAACAAAEMWALTPLEERIAVARRYAAGLDQHRDRLQQWITREVGKLPSDAAGEIAASIAKVELAIDALQTRRVDQQLTTDKGRYAVHYRPVGPTLVLGPYNFPLHLPGGQIIPALLAGNTIVFKPSELTPAVGRLLVDLWTDAGLPPGVLNLIQGDATVARQAIDDPRVAAVLVTGGSSGGVAIHRQLAGRPHVLLALEMGGNNPIVVASPEEPAAAAEAIVTSAFVSAGQRCTCARRLILVDDAAGRATWDAVLERTGGRVVGLPGDSPEPDVGPMVSARHANWLQQAEANFLAYGGESVVETKIDARCGALVHPGLVDMTNCHDEVDQEWFGPLLQVYWVRDFSAAVAQAAKSRYGLAAGLFGGDEAMFETFRRGCRAGVVNWNRPITGASGRLPFGGLAASGNHRPAGYFAVDFCNDPVASWLPPEPPGDTT